jgi:predicted nucleic acid-binding protein
MRAEQRDSQSYMNLSRRPSSSSDCMIAAMALNRNVVLYSFNVKHFGIVAGLNVQQPYSRL